MKRIVLCIMMMVLASCGMVKRMPHECPASKDSIRIITRLETLYVNDTIKVPVPLQSMSNKTKEDHSHLETDFAESDAMIDSTGTLHHTLKNKKGEVPVPTKTPVHNRDSIVFREVQVPVPYPVEVEVERNLTWFQQTQMIGFWIALVLLILKYRKSIFGFIRRFI